MGISRTPTLAKGTIAEQQGERIKNYCETISSHDASTQSLSHFFLSHTNVLQHSQYLKESSTKVVHTLFFMILGIQL